MFTNTCRLLSVKPLAVGEYPLTLRAYDMHGPDCQAFITIYVSEQTTTTTSATTTTETTTTDTDTTPTQASPMGLVPVMILLGAFVGVIVIVIVIANMGRRRTTQAHTIPEEWGWLSCSTKSTRWDM